MSATAGAVTQRAGLLKVAIVLSSFVDDLRGDHWSGVQPNEEGSTASQSLLLKFK